MMNVDSCIHICTSVPPEMKTTIDELTESTEKEAGMVRQVVYTVICTYSTSVRIHTRLTHTYSVCTYCV